MGAEIHVGYTQSVIETTPSGGAEIAGMPVLLGAVLAAAYVVAVALTIRPVLRLRRARQGT